MNLLLAALCLVLVIEGLLLFISPGGWKRMAAEAQKLEDRQLRRFGAVMIVVGLLALQLFR
jgi:uncharacterized protein